LLAAVCISIVRRPRPCALFPYTTLFRSARRVDDESRLMPASVVVPRRAERTVGAVVYVVGTVLHVPGTQVAVDEVHLVAVEGARDVLVDEPPHAGVGAGLEPHGHGKGKGIEGGVVADAHVVIDTVQKHALTGGAGCPGGTVHQGARVAVSRRVGGRGAGALLEA